MMQVDFRNIYLKKRFPLRISRGLRTGSTNLFISLTKDNITGWGEMAPGKTEGVDSAEAGQLVLQKFIDSGIDNLSVQQVFEKAKSEGLAACALAALDIALWDWTAKKKNIPLYQLLKTNKPTVPTSVTIGINPPEVVRERVPLLLDGTSVKALKIKLGSPEGIEKDIEMFEEVLSSTKNYQVSLRVDANGGWNVEEAIKMMNWLASKGVDYIEQPLAEGNEDGLPTIYKNRALPIYIDESCRSADDAHRWAHCVDGVNMKLMKCGGITGALQIIDAAKSKGLKTMIGCMGESSMSIAAAAALTGMLDQIDLDSHLNLDPDPCGGAPLINGITSPTDQIGHGAYIKNLENV